MMYSLVDGMMEKSTRESPVGLNQYLESHKSLFGCLFGNPVRNPMDKQLRKTDP
jgi:hypothetical protein